jgi:hypothetical protein
MGDPLEYLLSEKKIIYFIAPQNDNWKGSEGYLF